MKTLKHNGSIRDYIKRSRNLVLQVPDMSEGDWLFNFISNLSPGARQQVKLQKPQDLTTAIRVAEELENVEYVKTDSGKQKCPNAGQKGGYVKGGGERSHASSHNSKVNPRESGGSSIVPNRKRNGATSKTSSPATSASCVMARIRLAIARNEKP